MSIQTRTLLELGRDFSANVDELAATTYRSGETPKPGDVIEDRRPPYLREARAEQRLVLKVQLPFVFATGRGLPPPWGHNETWMPIRDDQALGACLIARWDKVREDPKGLTDALLDREIGEP